MNAVSATRHLAATIFVLVSANLLSADDSASTKWRSLFDGKTLDGWGIVEEEGKFFVEDGAIVGETAAGVKSSYLCTTEIAHPTASPIGSSEWLGMLPPGEIIKTIIIDS